MERCKRDFYVFLVRNLRFSRPNCTFSAWETYGSASGDIKRVEPLNEKIVGRLRDFCICQTV